jgi:hypothetical protein
MTLPSARHPHTGSFDLALHRGRGMDLDDALSLAEAATQTFTTDHPASA